MILKLIECYNKLGKKGRRRNMLFYLIYKIRGICLIDIKIKLKVKNILFDHETISCNSIGNYLLGNMSWNEIPKEIRI